jgi:hypothetical protein
VRYNAPTGTDGKIGVCVIKKDGSSTIIAQIQFTLAHTNNTISYRFPDDTAHSTTANCVYNIKLTDTAGGVSLPSGAVSITNTVGRTCP